MLGKRPRVPSMRRTTSMSRLGPGSCNTVSEHVPKEKQRATLAVASQLRAPGSGHTSVPSWKLNPSDSVQKCSNGEVLNNPIQISALGVLPEDTGFPETVHSSKPLFMGSQGQAQSHFHSGNSDIQSQKPIKNSIGAASELRGDHFLSIVDAALSGGGSSGSVYDVRDDRAFCSAECRYQQILIDENAEKHSVKLMATSSVPPVCQHNIGKNVQSRKVKNVQSGRRAAA